MAGLKHPVTPDGRYFVVRGRLWRLADPNLSAAVRTTLVRELMVARSAVRSAKLAGDQAAEGAAHHAVDAAKRKLGERGIWSRIRRIPHGIQTWKQRAGASSAPSLSTWSAVKRHSGAATGFAANRRSKTMPKFTFSTVIGSTMRVKVSEPHRASFTRTRLSRCPGGSRITASCR
jgi:hypothetical protein